MRVFSFEHDIAYLALFRIKKNGGGTLKNGTLHIILFLFKVYLVDQTGTSIYLVSKYFHVVVNMRRTSRMIDTEDDDSLSLPCDLFCVVSHNNKKKKTFSQELKSQ